jgi:flagellar hook-associated protein 3 FlgL
MLVNDLNRNMYTNLSKMATLQQQLSSTRRINLPSDDPGGLVKALRLRTHLVEGEQYLANI